MMLIGTYGTGYDRRNPSLYELLNPTDVTDPGSITRIAVESLSHEDACAAAAQLLNGSEMTATQAGQLARESEGNPYFLAELASEVRNGQHTTADGRVEMTLSELLWGRICGLPPEARRLLETVAVAGVPMRQSLAFEAAGMPLANRQASALLRSNHLVRGSGPSGDDEIEPYHERIRETVLSRMDPEARRIRHAALAASFKRAAPADFERVAKHLEAAGEYDSASGYYIQAAERALDAVAFNRAAGLFECALRLGPSSDDEQRRLRVRRAGALANAGHGVEAAQAYQQAAEEARESELVEYQRRAAYYFASSGRLDESGAAFKKTLAAVGLRFPSTPKQAIRSLIGTRLRLAMRGLQFKERSEGDVPAKTLRLIDTAWSAGTGLAMVDVFAGAAFAARTLLLALNAGEPFRIARSLAWEGAVRGLTPSERRSARPVLEAAGALVEKLRHPYTLGLYQLAVGLQSFACCAWPNALEQFGTAVDVFEHECSGVTWELATSRLYVLFALLVMGRFAELSVRTSELSKQAHDRGDLYTSTTIGVLIEPVLRLAADQHGAALRGLDDSLARWSQTGCHTQQVQAVKGRGWICLYAGDGAGAWAFTNASWQKLRECQVFRNDTERIWLTDLRARSALLAANSARDRRSLLASAERDIRKLEREESAVATPLAATSAAGVAAARGDHDGAIQSMEIAGRLFANLDMKMFAAAANRALGTMIGGERGRSLVAEADTWMLGQKVRNPARLAAAYTNSFCSVPQMGGIDDSWLPKNKRLESPSPA
jgi:tetratricopeptide (TPR) repeat protein